MDMQLEMGTWPTDRENWLGKRMKGKEMKKTAVSVSAQTCALAADENERRHTALQRHCRDLELRRFPGAMDATTDAIFLTDRRTMKFVDLNRAACVMTGRPREE